MGLIGKIWVKLGLDNSEFKQGIKGAEKEASGFQSFIKGVGPSVAAAFSIGAIVNFGKAAVKAYNESALALAKLESVIRSTGNASGLSSKQMQDYAAELQRVTTFEDDATINAMALLSTFKSIQGDTFKQTIASAQDLATVLGTDLNGAVMQLGKALEAPEIGLTMLRRSGISFSNQQIEQIKRLVEEGRKHEAQMVMLKEVQSQFGGAAKAAAATADGAWKQLGNTIGDVMEDLGSGVEGTKGMAKSMNDYLQSMRNMWKNDDIWTATKIWTTIFGAANNDALEFANAEAARKDKATKDNDAWVAAQMEGIKSIEDAEKAKAELGWQIMTERGQMFKTSLDMYVKEANKKQEQIQLDKEEAEAYSKTAEGMKEAQEKAKKAAIERASIIAGTIPNLEKLIEKLREQITLETSDEKRAAMNQDLANLERQLEVRRMTTAELKEYNALLERGTRNGGELPEVTTGAGGSGLGKVDMLDKSYSKLPKDAQKDFFSSNAYKKNIEDGKKAVQNMEGMIQEVEDLNQRFNDAIVFGISDALQTLVDELVETGKVDVGSVVTALVSPFGDMLIQLGEVALMSAIGIEAIKDSFSSMNPALAAAAGVALIALGSLVKAGVAQIGKTGGKSGISNTSFTGGSYTPQPATSLAAPEIVGVLKGEDLWLMNKKVEQRKGR